MLASRATEAAANQWSNAECSAERQCWVQQQFKLDVREIFFTQTVVRPWQRVPRDQWVPHF